MPTFYATVDADSIRPSMPDVAYLLTATSFWRRARRLSPVTLPPHVRHIAVDPGGFVAATRYGGSYPFTRAAYVRWLYHLQPAWAAMCDFCCEPAIAGNAAAVALRQQRTTREAEATWDRHHAAPWAWAPTVQGWTIPEYVRHATALRPLITMMQQHYHRQPGDGRAAQFRVGVGSICERAAPAEIRAVVAAVAATLPGVPLHLWGASLRTFSGSHALPRTVTSFDTSAWNGRFGRGINAYRQSGRSQREHAYRIALPAYTARVTRLLQQPRQPTFWEDPDDDHLDDESGAPAGLLAPPVQQ